MSAAVTGSRAHSAAQAGLAGPHRLADRRKCQECSGCEVLAASSVMPDGNRGDAAVGLAGNCQGAHEHPLVRHYIQIRMFARSVWHTAGTSEHNNGGIALCTRCKACLQYDLQKWVLLSSLSMHYSSVPCIAWQQSNSNCVSHELCIP